MKNLIKFSQPIIIITFFSCVLWVLIPLYIDQGGYTPPFAIKAETWPKVIAIIGLLMGILDLLMTFKKEVKLIHQREFYLYTTRILAAVLLFFIFYALLPVVGFLLANILLLFALLMTLVPVRQVGYVLVVSIVVPILLYIIFNKFVLTQFPEGMLGNYLSFLSF